MDLVLETQALLQPQSLIDFTHTRLMLARQRLQQAELLEMAQPPQAAFGVIS
jgi:hypothetical protein